MAWLSTLGSDWIDWEEDTFQVIIDGVRKNNSSLVDILTFLENEEPIGQTMFATSHTTGDFHGILIGTTHFIDVVSQKLYSDGFIDQTPFDEDTYEEHLRELANVSRQNKQSHGNQSRSEEKNMIPCDSKGSGGRGKRGTKMTENQKGKESDKRSYEKSV